MLKRVLLPFLIYCIWISCINAKSLNIPKKLQPDYMQIQFAGNIGLGSFGLGYFSKSHIHYYGLAYGYLPKWINDVEVHTISFKYACRFLQVKIDPTLSFVNYVGSNLNCGLTHNTYLIYPDYFPKGYYTFPNAIRFAPFVGFKLQHLTTNLEKIRSINFHCELGTIDYEMWHAGVSKTIHFYDIWNMAFGVSIALRK